MVDGGFERCTKGQVEYCQSNRNPVTYLLPRKCLQFAKKWAAVGASLSQQKTVGAAARDHGVNGVTLREAYRRAIYVAATARLLELVGCHSQYHPVRTEASATRRNASAPRHVPGSPIGLLALLWYES